MNPEPIDSPVRSAFRWLLAAVLLYAGAAHLAWARADFEAQVPDWVPLGAEAVVVLSGVVELALGAALLVLRRHRALVGWTVAAFFVAIFPGNVSQFIDGDAAFGLDSDAARGIRLLFQPLLVVWALWCTGAWATWRAGRRARPTSG
jgi:uncharacterized membrane protein